MTVALVHHDFDTRRDVDEISATSLRYNGPVAVLAQFSQYILKLIGADVEELRTNYILHCFVFNH